MIKEKAPDKNKNWGQVQIGTTSLILIFTVLSLTIFATLSLSSAKATQKLTEKNQQYVADYYVADGNAEIILKQINIKISRLAGDSGSEDEFMELLAKEYNDYYDRDKNTLSYSVDINKEQRLMVNLEIMGYNLIKEKKLIKEGIKNYKIKGWIVQNKTDYEIYDSIPVWDGNIIEN